MPPSKQLTALNYLYNYPDAHLVFYASDMKLHGESDASYNSEPGATSRAGGTFFLGKRTETFVNGTLDQISVRIDAVCSSAAEAEYASIFLNARKATVLRQTLSDMGYPQPPTPLASDMKLHGESDASYNSEPGATSRAGGTFFLGKRTETFVNGTLDQISVRIDAVCSSAAEAEYASIFLNARKATVLRQTLSDMDYP
jgi:hypothetical protein